MRIALYGLPCAGKTTLMGSQQVFRPLEGSSLLRQLAPDFPALSPEEKDRVRRELARRLQREDGFVMDGHYAFGEETVFTEEDGALYDAFLYLYADPPVLQKRMEASEKNHRWAAVDLDAWQRREIQGLRAWCHQSGKDFFLLNDPEKGYVEGLALAERFLKAVAEGFSCVAFGRRCARTILESTPETEITLTDGDRTLTLEDTSGAVFRYRTRIFDGDFYTGYQSWRQSLDFAGQTCPPGWRTAIHWNRRVLERLRCPAFVLTSGHPAVWDTLGAELDLPVFRGPEMSADAKYVTAKTLREAGRHVTAWGDSRVDWDMLREADTAFLVRRPDGSLSRSLSGCDLGGIKDV